MIPMLSFEYINNICAMLVIISEHRIESNAMPTIKHYTVTNLDTITNNQPSSLCNRCTIKNLKKWPANKKLTLK